MSVRVCPVCGSTELRAFVLVEAQQTPEGEWQFQPLNEKDLNEEMENPNNEVGCMNLHCGDPYIDGQKVNLKGNQTLFEYWKELHGMEEHITQMDLQQDQKEEYLTWLDGVYYVPWNGTIGECQAL